VSTPVDRDLVERLLSDGTLSFREIARLAGCSDWSVRAIARDLAGDSRPMKRDRYEQHDNCEDPVGAGGWAIVAAIAAALIGGLWLFLRRPPPTAT
jgi:hypothetical protein